MLFSSDIFDFILLYRLSFSSIIFEMKLAAALFTLSLALNATATPLGNRAIFRKHNGVPANNARRYILQRCGISLVIAPIYD